MSLARRVRREEERRLKRMDPRLPNNVGHQEQVNPQAQAAWERSMQEEHRMMFTKAELIVIFNVLTNVQAKYGDFMAIYPIVQKIQPIVAVDSNIPSNPPGAPTPLVTSVSRENS